MNMPMTYAKTGAAAVATIASAMVVALTGDQHISTTEWINIAISITTVLHVFLAPNVADAPVTKFATAFVTTALTAAVNLVADGVTISEWLQLLVAGLGTVSIYAVRNNPAGASPA